MEAQMTPIIPIKQAVISFAGHEFLAVQLPDGRIAVVLRHFCEALDLNFVGQIQRIQANPTLSKNFLLVRIKTPGGPQVVYALVVSVLSLWLGGFRLGRHSEEKQALIKLLQTEAADAFNSHFYKVDAQARPQQQTQTSQPPQPPPQNEPLLSIPEMFQALGTRLVQEMQRGASSRQTGLEQDEERLERRLGLVERQQMAEAAWRTEMQHEMQLQREQIEVLWSVVLGNAAAPEEALSADQQHALHLLLRYHQQATGQPMRAAEREVLGLVGAAGLAHLRQADWKPILAWFRQRLGR